jgi:hypothetical protein
MLTKFVAFLATWTTALYVMQPEHDSPGLARSIYAIVLRSLANLQQRQRHAIPRPSTSLGIEHYCRRHRVLIPFDDLQQSARLHWIDLRSSEGNILLYFRGGGHINPPVESGHVPLS